MGRKPKNLPEETEDKAPDVEENMPDEEDDELSDLLKDLGNDDDLRIQLRRSYPLKTPEGVP